MKSTENAAKSPYLLCVTQLFHEDRVLLDTWDIESLGLSTDSVDEVVVWNCCRCDVTLDGGRV